jgi:dynein light chain Tctex-type 1
VLGVDRRDPAGERDDQFETIKEQVEGIIGGVPGSSPGCIAKTLESPDKGGWLAAKVSTWTGDVVESVLKELMQLQKPFKYAVNAVIMQRNGAGMLSASSTYWDTDTDGSITVYWCGEHMHCTVTVFAFGIHVPPMEEE